MRPEKPKRTARHGATLKLSHRWCPCRPNEHRILQALGDQGIHQLKQVAQVLSIACSLDQRAGLERSRDAAKSQHISGLVEQVDILF